MHETVASKKNVLDAFECSLIKEKLAGVYFIVDGCMGAVVPKRFPKMIVDLDHGKKLMIEDFQKEGNGFRYEGGWIDRGNISAEVLELLN